MSMVIIPEYVDDFVPLAQFFDAIEGGVLTSDEGGGYWATDTMMDNYSDVWVDEPPEWATHVAWFGK